MVALSVLEQCRISPPPATGARPALPLTFFDIPWLDLNPVDRLFFYRFPYSTAVFLDAHLPNLKSSLSLTLNNFYPLAGTIRRSSAYDDRFEICYSDGDSVSLTVCEYENMDFGDISGYQARPFGKLLLLVPLLHKSANAQPVLAVQDHKSKKTVGKGKKVGDLYILDSNRIDSRNQEYITLLPNQGICLALKIHHAACDGFSSTHFLKSWAAAASRAALPPPPPSLDRSSISDPYSLYSKLAQTVLLQRSLPHHPNTSPSPTLIAATFTLPSHQIQILKQKLQSRAKEHLHSSSHISTFVISSACSWICLLRAQGNDDADDFSRVAHLFFSVDWRSRMRPPPPANYFGNFLGCPCFVKASVGDIVNEKDGFFVACELIGKAIEGIGDDIYEEMEGVIEKVKNVLPHKPLSIAGSPKLRVYDSDFGWGKPEKVEVTSIGGMGAISMAESRDDEGGVEIGVVLQEDDMVEFGRQFNMFLSKYD